MLIGRGSKMRSPCSCVVWPSVVVWQCHCVHVQLHAAPIAHASPTCWVSEIRSRCFQALMHLLSLFKRPRQIVARVTMQIELHLVNLCKGCPGYLTVPHSLAIQLHRLTHIVFNSKEGQKLYIYLISLNIARERLILTL